MNVCIDFLLCELLVCPTRVLNFLHLDMVAMSVGGVFDAVTCAGLVDE